MIWWFVLYGAGTFLGGLLIGAALVRQWLSHEWLMIAKRRLALQQYAARLAAAGSRCTCTAAPERPPSIFPLPLDSGR